VLSQEEGVAGTSFGATAKNFGTCHVLFQFDAGDNKSAATGDDGTVSVDLTLRADATAGWYRVIATCPGAPSKTAEFKVDASEDLTLTLSPDQGGPGTSFTATATGADSCSEISFQWDNEPPQSSTTATHDFEVPLEHA
jgi:hypothetical protein